VLVGYGAGKGQHALRVDGGPSTSQQKIYGLRPGTTYVLSGSVKMLSSDGEARLGVKDHGGDETFVAAKTDTKDLQQLEVKFTAGPNATTATIYCYLPDTAGAALFDTIWIRAASNEK